MGTLGLLIFAAAVGSGTGVRASATPPAWSPGDVWVWTWITGSAGYTRTWTVREQTTIEMTSGNWTVWHVSGTLVERSVSGNATITADLWIRPSDFGLAKEVEQTDHGQYVTVWNPPVSQAVFPLEDNAWTGTAAVWMALPTPTGSKSMTTTMNYTARALPETSVSVPAGTFRAVPILFSIEGQSARVAYYSDTAGNFVLIEDYSLGTLVRSESLTEYHRGFAPDVLWVAVGVGGAAVVVVVALLIWRARSPPPAPPPEALGDKPGPSEPSSRTPGEERSR